MGFATPNGNETEQLMLAQIWKMIGGNADGDGQVLLHNAKVVMCSMLNFHIDWMIDSERQDEEVSPRRGKIGRFENDIMYVTPNEISKITRKFVVMYRNRQTFLAKVHKNTH